MMSDKKAVKVGDQIFYWDLDDDKYTGCEFKKIEDPNWVQIIKVPDPKPEVPDEPMTRGSVVTIEGDGDFIAVRFTNADDLPYPFVASHLPFGSNDVLGWGNILSRAAGRRIIVHKTVDPNEAPVKVDTYAEWVAIPGEERKKYKWRDVENDIWQYDPSYDTFIPEGEHYNSVFDIKEYCPLVRDEKIG